MKFPTPIPGTMTERWMNNAPLGLLTFDAAYRLHRRGYGRNALAIAAGVSPYQAMVWRQRHGLSFSDQPTIKGNRP